MNLQDIVLPLADIIVWTFDSVLVPIGEAIGRRGFEWGAAMVGIAGLAFWLFLQGKYDKEADNNPDQLH